MRTVLVLLAAFALASCTAPQAPAPTPGATLAPDATAASEPPTTTATTARNGSGTPGLSLLDLVNKSHSLPAGYVPPDLVPLGPDIPATHPGLQVRQVIYEPLRRMLVRSKDQGLAIFVVSPYRSYDEQAAVFAGYAARVGEAEANRFSARPGQSEHQLGTAIDFSSPSAGYDLLDAFAQTPEGLWLAGNAYRYGFVMSYPAGKEATTGYVYEPWHFRYVGEGPAAEIQRRGITLTEYLESR